MSKSWKRSRKEEYPSIGDQLDALWKLLDPADGTEAKTIKDEIVAIKAAHPKPEEPS